MVSSTQPLPAFALLAWAADRYSPNLAICTSFQKEGMILVDMAARLARGVRVFTLDTGRLPEETWQIIDTVRRRYGIEVEIVRPDASEVEAMVSRHGPDLFRDAVPLRMLCCQVRKVRPLERKLATLDAWVTGLRRSQSEARADVPHVEEDARPVKINPLAGWTTAQVEDYIREHAVPLHPLYGRGYGSIGCEPCTRAGEGRSGRWWWEREAAKECGIHFSPDGKAERTVDVLLKEVVAAA